MANPIIWTPAADSILLQLRTAGVPWPQVGRHLHVGRSAAIERARSLGLPSKTRRPQPRPIARIERIDRPPLQAGHPVSWGAITNGIPYPYPVFL